MPDLAPAHAPFSPECRTAMATGSSSGLGRRAMQAAGKPYFDMGLAWRMDQPGDFNSTFLSLASDASANVNGVALSLDGRHHLQGM